MMLHVPQVLTTEQVRDLRAALEGTDWVDGRQTVGQQGAQVKRNRQSAEDSALCRALGQTVLAALARNALFFAAALPLHIVPPLFNRYEGEEHYGLHIDGAVRTVPHTGRQLRTDLSCTLFLCEPDDYDGGELEVVDTYGTHEVKLPAGDLILYPWTSLHCVHPVTRGARVCSFFWLQSNGARRSASKHAVRPRPIDPEAAGPTRRLRGNSDADGPLPQPVAHVV